jgi:hypothetical protein
MFASFSVGRFLQHIIPRTSSGRHRSGLPAGETQRSISRSYNVNQATISRRWREPFREAKLFLVSDCRSSREAKIRSFLQEDPAVAIILAAADFEWTVRRAIVALGHSPTKLIRNEVLAKRHGLDEYKDAWKQEVTGRVGGKGLAELVPNWEFFKKKAYDLRHKIIHGATSSVSVAYAQPRLEAMLAASAAVTKFAADKGEPLYGRMIRRLKAR